MRPQSFREYVLNHSPEDSPAGDFMMDAKHPQARPMPDAKTWAEIERWLEDQGGHAAITGAKEMWDRYQHAKSVIPVPIALGLTVRGLIELLQGEDPDAHVVKYHPKSKALASRVQSLSQVTISYGDREKPAVMLE